MSWTTTLSLDSFLRTCATSGQSNTCMSLLSSPLPPVPFHSRSSFSSPPSSSLSNTSSQHNAKQQLGRIHSYLLRQLELLAPLVCLPLFFYSSSNYLSSSSSPSPSPALPFPLSFTYFVIGISSETALLASFPTSPTTPTSRRSTWRTTASLDKFPKTYLLLKLLICMLPPFPLLPPHLSPSISLTFLILFVGALQTMTSLDASLTSMLTSTLTSLATLTSAARYVLPPPSLTFSPSPSPSPIFSY